MLSKPGPLTDTERRAMQKHTTLGHELLLGLDADDPLMLELVLHHHERWDGLGYPQGLKGEQINVAARRFSVVDSFDAMTSIRPYRTEVGAHAGDRACADRGGGGNPLLGARGGSVRTPLPDRPAGLDPRPLQRPQVPPSLWAGRPGGRF